MVEIIDRAKLAFVATVCADGRPNLSPKGSLRPLDAEHLIFADIASPQTIENLRQDPRLEINVVDFIARRGYRFRGAGHVLEPGDPDFEWMKSWLRTTHGESTPIHHAVKVVVEQVLPVLSPAYTFDGADEATLSSSWAARYGVE